MPFCFETERLRLREFTSDDHGFIRALDSDPEVMRYISDGEPSPEAVVHATIETFLGWHARHNGRYGGWVAEEVASGEAIGWFHMRPLKAALDDLTRLELGYRLFRRYWGKGYATEAGRFLVKHAFAELDAREVWALTMNGNLASQRVMEKCGLLFQREDTFKEFPGEDKGCVWYRVAAGADYR